MKNQRTTPDSFEQFGKEWKAEVMKMKKEEIIDLLLKPALEREVQRGREIKLTT